MANMNPMRERKTPEDGYMLITVIFLLFLLALSLSIAAPIVAKSIQRDREVETMERGKQYARAIQLYYRKFGSYPPSIDALVKTNNIRFLRKRYIDPLTGKADWKPIQFGQNKAPLAMGFFGEPLGGVNGTAIAGTGPSGGNTTSGAGLGTSGSGSSGSIGLFGSSSGTGTLGSSSSLFGSSSGTGTDASGTTGTTNSTGTATTGAGQTGATGTGATGSQTGQTFGGAGIVGVEPPLEKQSILTYKKKNHYNEWEFTYSPLSDQIKQISGNTGTIGQSASTLSGQSGTAGTTTTGTTGSTGSSGTTAQQPQQ